MKERIALTLFLMLSLTLGSYAQYKLKTDLPAIYIETFDGMSITSKDVYKYCKLHYVEESGLVTSYDSVSIRGRGNSTWNMAKKPYRIKFLSKEKFLGKGYAKCKKWTLLANAGDKTMMRNAITSAMGEMTSLKFNPAAKFVDLILNNQYQGTYQISDFIDVRPHRVNITEQDYPVADTTNITGGYLLEADGFKDGNYFTTDYYSSPIRIHYPDDEEILWQQTNYIKTHINNFEKALQSSTFADKEKGYRAYVDTASLLDWYICTEVSANIDGFYSTYFYKEQDDDRLFWGPLWDYDIAYNNDQRVTTEKGLSSSARSLMVDIAYNGSKKWVIRMWEDEWFQKAVYNRYLELLDAGLVDYLQEKIDSLQLLLSQSQELNYQKWGINKKMYHEMVLYSSYDQYVADLKQFITEHCEYLKQAFYDKKPLEPTPPFVPGEYYYHIINSKTGKAMDVSGSNIVQNSNNKTSDSQDWIIKQVGDYFQLINRSNAKALNDPTTGSVGPTTNTGTQLNLAFCNDTDKRQQWNIIPQGNAGHYNLENVYTQHIANLSGGNSADNTPILSYTSDSRNSTSQNRLWYIVANGEIPAEPLGIEETEPTDYALAYNPQTQMLHFGSETPEMLSFPVHIYTPGGMLVDTFRASASYSMAQQPAGIYIVTWTVSGKTRSTKFKK